MRRMFSTFGIAGCVLVLASCSQPHNVSVAHQETVDYETITVDEHVPESHFNVMDENGQTVELKLEDGPVLFVAQLSHCNDYLNSHEPLPDMRVVAVHPMEWETVEAMMKDVRRKLEQAGWRNVPLYGSMEPDIVEGVPTIA